jgi:hypothetical protein
MGLFDDAEAPDKELTEFLTASVNHLHQQAAQAA